MFQSEVWEEWTVLLASDWGRWRGPNDDAVPLALAETTTPVPNSAFGVAHSRDGQPLPNHMPERTPLRATVGQNSRAISTDLPDLLKAAKA